MEVKTTYEVRLQHGIEGISVLHDTCDTRDRAEDLCDKLYKLDSSLIYFVKRIRTNICYVVQTPC